MEGYSQKGWSMEGGYKNGSVKRGIRVQCQEGWSMQRGISDALWFEVHGFSVLAEQNWALKLKAKVLKLKEATCSLSTPQNSVQRLFRCYTFYNVSMRTH